MDRVGTRASVGGHTYVLETVVEHAAGGRRIVLCRDEVGRLSYVSHDEWKTVQVDSNTDQIVSNDSDALAPSVTRSSSDDEKVSLIMSLFRGRTDVYAQGYVGKRTKKGKLSYWPQCTQRWVRGACPKLTNPKAVCRGCEHARYAPLTSDVVKAHCKSNKGRSGRMFAIGLYVVDGDSCYVLVADFDGPGWKEAALAYRDVCSGKGLSPAVERSRSGNGAHVWVFFSGPVSAAMARRVGEGLLLEARDSCPAISFRSFDRLFPLQDSVADGDLGSLIALPLQGDAVRGGNSVFVDDHFEAFPDQCAYLSTLSRSTPEEIGALVNEFPDRLFDLPRGTDTRIESPSKPLGNTSLTNTMSLSKVPRTVTIRLADGVRISLDEIDLPLTNRLRQLAAFRNPEYTKKLRMHFSVWDTPRYIDLSIVEDGDLVLPRGCKDAVLSFFEGLGVEVSVVDERTDGAVIHATFEGRLRELQQPCRDALADYDLGVLVAPTGFGKSVVAASIIATHQVSTLVVVPNTALLGQWRASLSRFLRIEDEPPVMLTPSGRKAKHQPGTVGIIGGGKSLRSGIVDVALAGSLFEKGEVAGELVVRPYVSQYGMVIVDEAQHVAASRVLEVLRAVRARHVYAMTATPRRDDGLDRILFLECGPVRHEVAVKDQIAEQGMRRLLVPRLCSSRPDLDERKTWHSLVDYISSNEERNRLIATDVSNALSVGRTPLVLTRRVEHARHMAKEIASMSQGIDAEVVLLVGSDDEATRRHQLERLGLASPDKPLCVVATGSYVGEGFDCDRLDTLFLAGPVAFEGSLAQWAGRLHRVRPGKEDVVAVDYIDVAIPMMVRNGRGGHGNTGDWDISPLMRKSFLLLA